ncbi:hypothetical protein [Turneriella parva]|uniref:Uncharacterized protein n=1 Tax=Turneriella parva (strain ATCC BAA-1111 / DSM 21527 / NCTC 11395 / H) TaxID=869212 RepID=I4BAZ3_TURPD|nr:hypothetical protein [Turneriella parva]AFM14450.1 hypothetical protein Turpa_3816 [Turneriella parva DSM 21527]
MLIPYEKPFAEFLRFISDTYAKAEYPEAYIPYIAHKATAGYVLEKYFPELLSEFSRRNGEFVYAISEPGWKNSPLNMKSELRKKNDGTFELYANKGFVLDADLGVFAVKHESEFALVIVDTDYYRNSRVALEMPEATYKVGPDKSITHYRCEFTATLDIVPFRKISKRDILLISRTVVFREQVAYAVLAAAEAAKHHDMAGLKSRVDLLCQRAKEEPGHDDIAVAREILSAAIVRILAQPNAHGFWKWLGRFVKPD